jgi:integrase
MHAEEMPAAHLGAQHIRQLLERVEGAASPRARFGALSRFMDWCQEGGHIEANPCTLVPRSRRPKAPQARAQHLTAAELARLWQAAERLHELVWRDLARFLIALPCRRGEAAKLDWSHLDLAVAEWRWTADQEPRSSSVASACIGAGRAARAPEGRPGLRGWSSPPRSRGAASLRPVWLLGQ